MLVIFSSPPLGVVVSKEIIELFDVRSLKRGLCEEVSWNEKFEMLSMTFMVVMFIRSHLVGRKLIIFDKIRVKKLITLSRKIPGGKNTQNFHPL